LKPSKAKDERDPGEALALGIGIFVVVGAVAAPLALRQSPATPPVHAPASKAVAPRGLRIPHAADVLRLDGELDEPSWRASARTGSFLTGEGKEATPYSDARFAWTQGALRVGLYASDEDIVAARVPADGPVWQGDAFHLVIETDGVEHVFDVGPTCVLADGERRDGERIDYAWQSDAKLACDADGTIDVPGDMDEEWVVEMEIPLAALGLQGTAGERAEVRIRRCDVGSGQRRGGCGEIAPTVLILGE